MAFYKKLIISLIIFIVSFIAALAFTGFDPEGYLTDDNRTQWFPVIEESYSTLFETGTMPVYDFFQFKGMPTAEPGYYGIMNPIIAISYILSNIVHLPFSTLTIYISILFGLGNICFFWLCVLMKNSMKVSALFTVCYSTMASFFAFSYWYYVFNNYLFIPLLIYIFIKSTETKTEYFGCGMVLALESIMGNTQYLFYHYIIYALICFIYVISNRTKYIKIFFTNIISAVVASAPFLLLTMRSGSDFRHLAFNTERVAIKDLIIGALFPAGIVDQFTFPYQYLFRNVMGRNDFEWLYNGSFVSFWIVIAAIAIISGIINLVKMLKTSDMHQNVNVKESIKRFWKEKVTSDIQHALIFCILFFTSFVINGIVAKFLGILPVIKNFRFLFKCLFVLQPLVAVITAASAPYLKKKLIRAAVTVMSIFAVIGLVNNVFVTNMTSQLFTEPDSLTLSEEREYADQLNEEYMPDLDTYRSVTSILSDWVYTSTHRYYNGLLRNFPTTEHVYSLLGYEIAAPKSHYEQIEGLTSESTRSISTMVGSTINSALISAEKEQLTSSLASNAVKYIMLEKDPGNIYYTYDLRKGMGNENNINTRKGFDKYIENYSCDIVIDSLKSKGIAIEDILYPNENYVIVVLADPVGLCTDTDGSALPLTAERMDLLSFESTGSDSYKMSFSYDDRLTAYVTDASGNTAPLEITEADDGNAIIHTPAGTAGRIYLGYRDGLCTVGFIFEALICVMSAATFVLVCRGRSKQEA